MILLGCTCRPWRNSGGFDDPQPRHPWRVVRAFESCASDRLRRPTLTRRGFTIRLASVFAAGLTWPAWGQDALEPFRSLSARLTGFSVEEIDPGFALAMMEGLRAAGEGPDLDILLQNAAADGNSELARRIAVAWYSGMHPTAAGLSLRTYHDALVWRALEFAKPPGRCSALPGDWSEPPPESAAEL